LGILLSRGAEIQNWFCAGSFVSLPTHNGNAHLNLEKMERSVLLAYEKAFNTTNEKILRLRRKSYGNFYKILAGSYFSAGNYRMFIKKMIKSLWLKPSNIQHYIKFPIR
jgi:hypothetical protein